MKNFTNNFKQFTSRLSARWLIMALMLLLGTSSAWADGFFDGLKVGYYPGTGNDIWTDYNTSDIGTLSGQPYLKGVSVKTWQDNVTSVSIEIKNGNTTLLSATNATKISEWNNGNQVNWNKEWELLTNIALPKTSGVHTISVIAKTNYGTTVTYTLTYSIPCDNVDDSQIRIEIASATSYTKVYAWYDSNSELLGEWSGAQMTTDGTSLINGQTVKYITISRNSVSLDKSVNIIFNNEGSSQSGDITGLKWGNIYYFDKNGGNMESKCLEPACETPQASDFTYTAPANLDYNGQAKSATVVWKTGTGSGAITKYYKSGSGSYSTTAPTNVGTYTVAVKTVAGGNYCATEDYVQVGTFTIKCIQPAATNFTYTAPANLVYNGQAKAATVTWKSGTGTGTITKYYKTGAGSYSTTVPTNIGTYTVAVKTVAGGNYCATEDYVQVGTFTITCAQPTATNFTYTAPANLVYNGQAKSATVVWKQGTGSGTITKYYKSGSDSYSTTAPTNVGTYTVAVKTVVGGNYCATEDYVQVGTFTITCAKPIADNFIYTAPANLVYNGQAKSATVAWKQGTGTGNITIYYKSTLGSYNTTAPSAAGAYTVAVKTVAGGNYCATDDYVQVGSFTITCPGPTAPIVNVIEDEIIKCNSNTTQVARIQITNYSAEYDYKINNQDISKASIEVGGYVNISVAGTYTLYAINECDGKTPSATSFTIKELNVTPTISGETFTQPGKANAIELTVPTGISANWSVEPNNADLSVTEGNSTMFSAETNDTYTITATNGTCSATHVVTVADAFYIWVRNAKESDTAYGQFYYPNENSEAVRGGEMYYAECDALPTSSNYSTYNRGGREADLVQNDCDGYTWYGFKASEEVISGTKYFYVHATNDISNGGYYTHSKPLKGALTGDVYYTLGTTGDSYRGWNLATASAPYAGPKVHASGSTTLGTDKFAALYVTDCSGKEITGYQWYKDGQPYSYVCSYVGKKGSEDSYAGKTNNIRPTVAGNYSCTVTYEGGTTATSAAVEIDGTYNRSFTSTIPVLVVNTGDEDFPGCQASGTNNYPSKYADELKAKRSVDVKIYDGEGALVYDRKARMAYRGSSSLNFTKKSYAFCPGKANCGDEDKGADYVKTEKLNMLGVGNAVDKDWVLYAAAADPSLMRNRMVFDTYQAMRNDWGVHSRYVELIVNGDYKGVYVFMDKITMNENRVEVNEDNGFIVKFDKTDCADRVEGYNGIFGDQKTFSTERTGRYDISTYHTTVDQLFEIEYPEKDDYPTGWANKVASIKEMFQAFEDALEAGDYATVQKYIDYDSWADWFIINEFTKNLDAYRASCIFVYTGEAGAKIEARPLWDQELSFNNAAANISGKGANSTSGLLIQNDGVYTDCFPAPFWFTGQLATFGNCGVNNGSGEKGDKLANCLLNDPCFVQVVKEKWNQHQFDALSAEKLNALVTKYTNELGDAALERESTKWPDSFRTSADCSAGGTGYNEVSHSDSKEALTDWIADGDGGRREGLTTAINGLTGASFSIQIIPSEATTTPWEPVEIAVSVTPAGYDYKLEYTDNDLGSVANTIIEEEGDKITYRIPRPWPAGDEQQEGERTDIEYGIKATLNVQDGTTVCGSQAAPSSTAKIILQDEPNDECPQP